MIIYGGLRFNRPEEKEQDGETFLEMPWQLNIQGMDMGGLIEEALAAMPDIMPLMERMLGSVLPGTFTEPGMPEEELIE
jgi:hypothetical protein